VILSITGAYFLVRYIRKRKKVREIIKGWKIVNISPLTGVVTKNAERHYFKILPNNSAYAITNTREGYKLYYFDYKRFINKQMETTPEIDMYISEVNDINGVSPEELVSMFQSNIGKI
jgi:hypothetical protein